jgi:hypothetical protein
MKLINALCGKNSELLYIKACVRPYRCLFNFLGDEICAQMNGHYLPFMTSFYVLCAKNYGKSLLYSGAFICDVPLRFDSDMLGFGLSFN